MKKVLIEVAVVAAILFMAFWLLGYKASSDVRRLRSELKFVEGVNENLRANLETAREFNSEAAKRERAIAEHEKSRRAEIESTNRQLQSEIADLESQKVAGRERLSERINEVQDLPPDELTTRSVSTLANLYPDSPAPQLSRKVIEEKPAFVADQNYVQASLKAAIEAGELRISLDRADLIADKLRSEIELHQDITSSYKTQLDATEEKCLACEDELSISQQLMANQQQRIELQLKQVKALERKLMWRKWRGWLENAGMFAAGYGARAVTE